MQLSIQPTDMVGSTTVLILSSTLLKEGNQT